MKDLTGKKIGRLRVIGPTAQRDRTYADDNIMKCRG